MRALATKFYKDVARFIGRGDYVETDSGLLVHGAIKASGLYVHTVNGEDERRDHNLVPAAGILHFLEVTLRNQARFASWYVAPYSGAVTPAANWTAANFAATASEITSGTEGYSEATRQQWVAAAAAAGKISNLASKASFTIVATSTININGAGLLSDQAKGSTTGALISASRFAATRVVNNGDTWECGYEIELTDL
ncbi:MAG: hypothetical protein ACRCWJ_20155 [Casimicrobium sp.]